MSTLRIALAVSVPLLACAAGRVQADPVKFFVVVRGVVVQDEVVAYVGALVRATRQDLHFALGASPQGGPPKI